jgi:hypothetical protein
MCLIVYEFRGRKEKKPTVSTCGTYGFFFFFPPLIFELWVMKKMSCCVIFLLQAAELKKKEDKERKEEEAKNCDAAEQALMDLYEVVMQDFMFDPDLRLVVFCVPLPRATFQNQSQKITCCFPTALENKNGFPSLFLESEGVS